MSEAGACVRCGTLFERSSLGRPRLYCDKNCGRRKTSPLVCVVFFIRCVGCGRLVTRRQATAMWCSDYCRIRAVRSRKMMDEVLDDPR